MNDENLKKFLNSNLKSLVSTFEPLIDKDIKAYNETSPKQRLLLKEQRLNLIKKLQNYVDKIDKYGTSRNKFSHGFNFFCIPIFTKSRALNREANYLLATQLINELKDPTKDIADIFSGITEKRRKIFTDRRIGYYGIIDKVDPLRGINSSDLNAVIDEAKKFTR